MKKDFLGNTIITENCTACEIAKGNYLPPKGVVFENAYFIVHQDPYVALPFFFIISPKRHVYSIDALTSIEKCMLGSIIALVEEAVKSISKVEFLSIIQEDSVREGHLHMWVFPWHNYVIEKYSISLSNLRDILSYYSEDTSLREETIQAVEDTRDYINRNQAFQQNDFHDQYLCDQDFSDKDLSHANFKGAILKRCNFNNCDLSLASFDDADLYKATFYGAKLYSTSFRSSDLTRADFRKADLYGIKIFGADVTHTIFDDIVTEEHNGDYDKAEDIYNTIKRVYAENGNKEISAKYYYKECVARRKKKKGIARFLDWLIADLIIGYGEKLNRCLVLCCLSIFGFGSTYFALSGFSAPLDSLLTSFSLFLGFDSVGFFANNTSWGTLYVVEQVIGFFLIALALIGLARKIVRD